MSTITSAMEPFSCASAAARTKVVRKPWAMVAHTHTVSTAYQHSHWAAAIRNY